MQTEVFTFSDGIFDLYEVDKYGKKGKLKHKAGRFQYRTLGATRYYAARSAQIRITDLIAIPLGIKSVREDDIIVIAGTDYAVKQAQIILDGKPPHKLITLQRSGAYE